MFKKKTQTPALTLTRVYTCTEDPDCRFSSINEQDIYAHTFTATHCEKCGFGNDHKISSFDPCDGCLFEHTSPPFGKKAWS